MEDGQVAEEDAGNGPADVREGRQLGTPAPLCALLLVRVQLGQGSKLALRHLGPPTAGRMEGKQVGDAKIDTSDFHGDPVRGLDSVNKVCTDVHRTDRAHTGKPRVPARQCLDRGWAGARRERTVELGRDGDGHGAHPRVARLLAGGPGVVEPFRLVGVQRLPYSRLAAGRWRDLAIPVAQPTYRRQDKAGTVSARQPPGRGTAPF